MVREMKDSGIAWIGKIPVHWDVSLLKYAIQWKSVKGYPDEPILSLYRDYGVVPKDSRDDNHNVTSLDTSGYKVVDIGDLVINKMKAWQGSMAVSKYRGIVSPAYHVCRIIDSKINKRYLHYLLRNPAYLPEYMRLSSGLRTGQWDLGFDDFKTIPFIIPSLNEQEQIVNFIDSRCIQIDAVLEKTRASIEEYKKLKQAVITQAVTKGIRGDRPMKESGIPWIGSIPAEWNVSTLGKFISIDSGISVGKKYALGTPLVEVPYLRVANVQGDHIDLSDVATIMVTLDEAEKYKLKAGQLLMTEGGDRDKLGRGCLWSGEIENCIHQNHVFAVQTDERLTVKYLDYLTTSEVARVYFDLTAKKTTNLACTSKSTIQKFVIPVPSVTEQTDICDYLNKECKKLDEMLQAKANIIEQLNNYKKSLVYEYVTGKKDVPPYQSVIAFVDARALLLCRIIELLRPKGRIHLMKGVFSTDCILNLNSEIAYLRQKHGPYDPRIEEYENILVKNGWISIKRGNSVEYILTDKFESYREMYQKHYGNIDSEIQRICAFLRPMKTSQAERVATLLAVWNDFIIDGIVPTDKQIVEEVRSNWTSNKAHSSESTWMGTLAKMKVHQITPSGYGKHTIHMQDSEV